MSARIIHPRNRAKVIVEARKTIPGVLKINDKTSGLVDARYKHSKAKKKAAPHINKAMAIMVWAHV